MSRQQETSKLLAEFKANPLVKEWIETLTSESAKELYSQFLYTYFNHSVKVRGFTIKAWVEEVGNQRTSMNAKDRRAWATELSSFLNTYISPVTSKPYAGKTRKTINTAIKSFLVFHAGDLEGKVGKQPADQSYADAKRKEELTPISIDEFKKLVFQATNTRDRAMLLSLAVGLGTGEWVEFADESWKYTEAIRAKTVPLRVNIVRPKKPEEAYFVLMWDDAIDSLNLLLEKRERDLGHPLKKGDYLFVNKAGGRVIEHRVQRTVRELAEASGVEARELGRIIYRIRPAEIGRDFFRTLCEHAEVPTTIAEFSLGHKIE